MTPLLLVLSLLILVALLYWGRAYWAWVLAAATAFAAWYLSGLESPKLFYALAGLVALLALVFGFRPLRRLLISRPLFPVFAKILPKMGDTERIALEAGSVWWDGEIFSGKPNWKKLLDFKPKELSAREREFLEGPTEELCRMLDDWHVTQIRDLPPEVWAFIKEKKFFGMIIPESYGGLGFSAYAHAQVITKLSSRCITGAVTVMVPNSLGPAELLHRYGTDEQKNYYLPRLADGREIPSFALTEPEAGSDAAGALSHGVIERGVYEGKEVLGMRLNWHKRYITLGPVCTLLGLAFRLYDPNGLLGSVKDLGITCALVPPHLPGIEIGKRHDPLGVPFQNGPNSGKDVFVPLDFIIGGPKMAGKGWRMLMECLGAGRGISLPSLAVGANQVCTRVIGAYATVREQFDTPIGYFEGVEEPMARIAGFTYWATATRRLTLAAVDEGQQPAVLTAIAKAFLTESMRRVVNDAMDIQAGAGIIQGPRNILGKGDKSVPIGITVEGANILTRSLIIYGQGAIRCHPFVHREMQAVATKNIKEFDRAFFGHVGFVFSNLTRAALLAWTGGALASAPGAGELKCYFGKLSRYSAAFVTISDFAMATLGGTLKRREKISGRLADALSWLYIGSAVLKKYHDEGRPVAEAPVLKWAITYILFQIQKALRGVLQNLPNRPAAWLLTLKLFPLGARLKPPNDQLGAEVAQSLLEDREARLALTKDIYLPDDQELGLGRLEVALDAVVEAHRVEAKIRQAIHEKKLKRGPREEMPKQALEAGVLSPAEVDILKKAAELRDEVIQVDAFTPQEFCRLHE